MLCLVRALATRASEDVLWCLYAFSLDCTYTNPDSIAYYTLSLYGSAYCS
jgi:hypothetical protein